jgi:hypothetical protein
MNLSFYTLFANTSKPQELSQSHEVVCGEALIPLKMMTHLILERDSWRERESIREAYSSPL